VNHWVTDGHWFDAETTLGMLRRFELRDVGDHADACAWLSAFVRLYEPVIARVLRGRDRVLRKRPDQKAALDDRRIEVVSTAQLDWSDDLRRLEAEVRARGLDAAS
jgi:hypothetical protein